MKRIIIAVVCVFAGGVAFAAGQKAMNKADRLASVIRSGEVTLLKLVRPAKSQARLLPFECPAGQRDVMDEQGAVIGCVGRK